MGQYIIQEKRAEGVKVLGEDIHHGVQRVVTRGRHPLSFLPGRRGGGREGGREGEREGGSEGGRGRERVREGEGRG